MIWFTQTPYGEIVHFSGEDLMSGFLTKFMTLYEKKQMESYADALIQLAIAESPPKEKE